RNGSRRGEKAEEGDRFEAIGHSSLLPFHAPTIGRQEENTGEVIAVPRGEKGRKNPAQTSIIVSAITPDRDRHSD
ncbi:hypothetical protein B6V73_20110, partial [Thioclava sp. JM3]